MDVEFRTCATMSVKVEFKGRVLSFLCHNFVRKSLISCHELKSLDSFSGGGNYLGLVVDPATGTTAEIPPSGFEALVERILAAGRVSFEATSVDPAFSI